MKINLFGIFCYRKSPIKTSLPYTKEAIMWIKIFLPHYF